MAQKLQVLLTDDLDGGNADQTITFSLDGTTYEIDLSNRHAGELRAALAKYAEHARKARPRGRAASRASRNGRWQPAHARHLADIREWARKEGYDVKDRGRVAAGIVAEYQAAHEAVS